MMKKKPDEITSPSSLLTALRKQKKGTLRERVLRSLRSATVWDHGKKVIDDGKVVDEAWLKEKLVRMRGRKKRADGIGP